MSPALLSLPSAVFNVIVAPEDVVITEFIVATQCLGAR